MKLTIRNQTMWRMVFLLMFAGSLRTIHAQRPDLAAADTARKRLAPLTWLVGEWSGPATVSQGPQPMVLTQRESVSLAANGTVLMVQGRGSMKGADNVEREIFQAAGMLTYDVGAGRFTWISSGGSGYLGVSEAQVNGDGFVWWLPERAGVKTRYAITKTPAGEWREVGETSRDGTTWTRIFEMTLTKK